MKDRSDECSDAMRDLQRSLILAFSPTLKWLDSRSWFTVKTWMMDIVNEH